MLATTLGLHPLSPEKSHRREVVLAARGSPDLLGNQIGPARRSDDSAPDAANELRGLAVLLGCGDDRSSGREDPVHATGNDVARQSTPEADEVDVRARERLREQLARLVVEERDLGPRRCSSPAERGGRAARRTRSGRPTGCSRSASEVEARISVSRSWAWPMLPECMTTKRPSRPFERAHELSRGCGVTAFVSTQLGITRRRSGGTPFASSRSRIVSPIATTRPHVADRSG